MAIASDFLQSLVPVSYTHLERKTENKPGTYDCSDFGDGYRIFSTVYGLSLIHI